MATNFPIHEDAPMYPSKERRKLLEALGALRKVFLVSQKAFEVADIVGKPDERREAMRALHGQAIDLTNDLDNVEDLEAVRVKLDRLLIEMAARASANEIAAQNAANNEMGTGYRDRKHRAANVTNDERAKYSTEDVHRTTLNHDAVMKAMIDASKAATAPLLSDEQVDRMWNDDMFELGERRGTDGYVLSGENELFEEGYRFGMKRASKFFQAKIASGELMTKAEFDKAMMDLKILHGISNR